MTTTSKIEVNTQRKGEIKQATKYKTSNISIRVFLRIVPLKVMKNDDETISQSTLIREDFVKQLKLKGYSRAINTSSIKDKPENVKVK